MVVDAMFSELERLQIFGGASNLDMINGHIFGDCNKQRVTVYNGNIIENVEIASNIHISV